MESLHLIWLRQSGLLVVHLEFLVVQREFHKPLIKRSYKL